MRRQLNQALFDKIYLDDADDDGGTVHVLAEPFELLLSNDISTAARDRDENRNTPNAEGVEGVNVTLLVGVEGLEPPTLSV